jgi:hypothetical protein
LVYGEGANSNLAEGTTQEGRRNGRNTFFTAGDAKDAEEHGKDGSKKANDLISSSASSASSAVKGF